MPSKYFTDGKISGRIVENGWIVSNTGFNPWYLNCDLPKDQKLSSEVFMFEKKVMIENVNSKPTYGELLSERDQKSLKAIHSIMNICQLTYHRIAKNVFKKMLVNSVDEIERNELQATHDHHIEIESGMAKPTSEEIKDCSSFITQQPTEECKSTKRFTLKFF